MSPTASPAPTDSAVHAEQTDEQHATASLRSHRRRPTKRLVFTDDDRAAHLAAFHAWLPEELRDAQAVDWDALSGSAMGYLIHTVGNSPWATHVALAAGVWRTRRLRHGITEIHRLLRFLWENCGVTEIGQLADPAVWEEFLVRASEKHLTSAAVAAMFKAYATLVDNHEREYVQRLSAHERARIQPYLLPPPPARFSFKHGLRATADAESAQRRKEQSDVLVPLYPVLIALVQLRYQMARRFVDAFRAACATVDAKQSLLPYTFSYEETFPDLNREACTVSQVQLAGRRVTLRWTLWDRRTWVLAHADAYSRLVRESAQFGTHSCSDAHNQRFLEFMGPADDLLWFGELVEQNLIRAYGIASQDHTPESLARQQQAREFGAATGFRSSRTGVLNLTVSTAQFFRKARQIRSLILEPMSIYRGILFGSAMLLISLTSGARVSELLQVSADRFRTRRVAVTIKRDGNPRRQERTIYLQHLLPKGRHGEQQRQLFPISRQAMELLEEITSSLRQEHQGHIPVVRQSIDQTKLDDLQPERYLFQWAASQDGRRGAFRPHDVVVLMRFVLHGLEVTTVQGKRIFVAPHLLRHVFATAARHTYQVPGEAVAWVLHHKMATSESTEQYARNSMLTHAPLPPATEYYSRETEDHALERVATFQLELDLDCGSLDIMVPDERDLESMNESLRDVFARWHTLHPTVFGMCGCPMLCPRGTRRGLCLGCSYLVPDPSKYEDVLTWRASFARQVEELEAAGNLRDALEQRRTVQELDDLANVMRLQMQAEADRRYVPFYKTLPMAWRAPTPGTGESNDPDARSDGGEMVIVAETSHDSDAGEP